MIIAARKFQKARKRVWLGSTLQVPAEKSQRAFPCELSIFGIIARTGGIGEGVIGIIPINLQRLAGRFGRRDHRFTFGQIHGHGLFHQDMLAGSRRGQGAVALHGRAA